MRILSRLLLFVTVAICTIAAQPANSDRPQQPAPFTIEISAQQNTHVGAPLQLHVKITNASKKNIILSQDMTKKAEFFNTIYVRDAGGIELVKTDRHRAFRMEPLSTAQPTGFTFNDFAVQLQPGEAIQDETDIRTLYEIDQPGKYTIQVQRVDNETKTTVKSNTITVTIVPQSSPSSDTVK